MRSSVQILIDPERIRTHWSEKHDAELPGPEVLLKTEAFKEDISQKWKVSQETIFLEIQRITGLTILGDFTVFVLPPDLEEAQYLDSRTIEWGYQESHKNSIVIGIAHELIHCLTHEFYSFLSDDEKWLFHALVYLSADEEIRFVLNGRSEYFDSPTIGDYHERLIKIAKDVLPFWKEYLEDRQRGNILDFYSEIKYRFA